MQTHYRPTPVWSVLPHRERHVSGPRQFLAVFGLIALPISNGLSRAIEYQADEYALQVTKMVGAYKSAMELWRARPYITSQEMEVIASLRHTPLCLAGLVGAFGGHPGEAECLIRALIALELVERRDDLYTSGDAAQLYCALSGRRDEGSGL